MFTPKNDLKMYPKKAGGKMSNTTQQFHEENVPDSPMATASKRFKRFRSRHHKVGSQTCLSNNVSLDQQSLKEGT